MKLYNILVDVDSDIVVSGDERMTSIIVPSLEAGIGVLNEYVKDEEPEKPARKIDDLKFQGWYMDDECAVNGEDEALLDCGTYPLGEAVDVEKLMAAAPDTMRLLIEARNALGKHDVTTGEMELYEKIGALIRKAGFGCDIGDED